jgi:hypothetical protein
LSIGNWIVRGLHSSVSEFLDVGRGNQAQDARYWLDHTILVGRSMWRRTRKWGANRGKGISGNESIWQVLWLAPWSGGWYKRYGGLDGDCRLRAFDEKPDLVTSIHDLDEWAPCTFSS